MFYPMHLIYGGKTRQSIPRYHFPEDFCLSANPKYFSNIEESTKFLENVIIRYVTKEKSNSHLPDNQKALMIMDSQITPQVIRRKEHSRR